VTVFHPILEANAVRLAGITGIKLPKLKLGATTAGKLKDAAPRIVDVDATQLKAFNGKTVTAIVEAFPKLQKINMDAYQCDPAIVKSILDGCRGLQKIYCKVLAA